MTVLFLGYTDVGDHAILDLDALCHASLYIKAYEVDAGWYVLAPRCLVHVLLAYEPHLIPAI